MIKKIIVIASILLVTGCASLPDSLQSFGRVALDRAQTISNALALRDAYIELDKQIRVNSKAFSDDEIVSLKLENENVQKFYLQIVALSRGGSADKILVNADEFLTTILTVRASIDSAIRIIEPKIQSLNADGAVAAGDFIASYRQFSLKLDLLLAKNNRAEAVRMTATFLKAAVPVIVSFIK